MLNNFEILIRLLLSSVIGGAIGTEREVSNRPAGLRTHILVSVGSSLIMMVSIYGFSGEGDPSRLAAQVVSGIGFLGAGTIIRTGNDIKGLTTAASLWVCSGIGLAIGAGYYLGGVITAGIVLISLAALGNFERRVARSSMKKFHIIAKERPGLLGDLGTIFGNYFITIKDIAMIQSEEGNEDDIFIEFSFKVKMPAGLEIEKVIRDLYNIKGVSRVIAEGKAIS
jgi:putative Mg2+ transporter-C (MgtC) family protein